MIADRTTLSIAKAGELVGVTRRTIYNWIAGGKVEYVRTAGGFRADLRRYTVARSACRRHPAGYARNLGRRLNTLRGLNVALPRLPAPLRRASPVPWSGAPPQAATGASAPSAPKPGAVVRPTRRRVPGTGGFPDRPGGLERGRRLTGRGESPAPADRVVSLSPSCRAAAGTVSRATVSDSTPTRVARTAARSAAPKSRPPVSIAGRRRAAMADAPSAPGLAEDLGRSPRSWPERRGRRAVRPQ